ncbi:helix-turn-helix domain-containing protein [Mycolicibacterium sp. NCC-Tsukiji]|uniref:winged helix-turn-helix transcriptional regulator n=1 Tax=Mycolicibacterium sp. NCC-Tsukiji TaxID=2185272 RepID=UPI000ECDFE00|nr:helix-turn-helix domain-containing protein [Mycolicibacterium sp. NCC-Tsukiji]GCA97819.1 transcriptional regulator [Mycolicibacterium sp. NCC-Tsukiji]
MSPRSYGQYCAVARSLDLIGDRWSLLVVRELLDGPQRYGELLSALAPIATDVLAGRLRYLEEHGVVHRPSRGRPAARVAYELTDRGRDLQDVVDALARWGRPLLTIRHPGDVVRPRWWVRAVRAHLRPDRGGPTLVVRFEAADATSVTLRITADDVQTLTADAPADVVIAGEIESLAASLDPYRVSDLTAGGQVRVEGSASAVRRLSAMWRRD